MTKLRNGNGWQCLLAMLLALTLVGCSEEAKKDAEKLKTEAGQEREGDGRLRQKDGRRNRGQD